MKYIVVVRHGDYGRDGHLNNFGFDQMNALAEKLKFLIGDARVAVMSSPAIRARESAIIIANVFGVDYGTQDFLSEDSGMKDIGRAIAFADSDKKNDALILVAHGPCAELFVALYCGDKFGKAEMVTMGKGEAVMIDCEARKVSLVAP